MVLIHTVTRESPLFYTMVRNVSPRKANMGQLHTNDIVYYNYNKFLVGLGISSREAQFLQHTRNVMKMTLLYSQTTVRGKY